MRIFRLGTLAKLLMVAALCAMATSAFAGSINVVVGDAKKYRLNNKPNVVVIGNPRVADVIIEDNRVMFVIGLSIGETSLHILDSRGTTIMRQKILVRAPSRRHVTVLRGSRETQMTCQGGRCYNRPSFRVRRMPGGSGGSGTIRSGRGNNETTERTGDLN